MRERERKRYKIPMGHIKVRVNASPRYGDWYWSDLRHEWMLFRVEDGEIYATGPVVFCRKVIPKF